MFTLHCLCWPKWFVKAKCLKLKKKKSEIKQPKKQHFNEIQIKLVECTNRIYEVIFQ